jgi:hypothetical protein
MSSDDKRGRAAYTDSAIDQASRAVTDLLRA